jgi:uridine kinase
VSDAAQRILGAIDGWRSEQAEPLVVAIDGHGAAGKTTIAADVAAAMDVIVLHTDDYFLEAREGGDPRPMAQYYAWELLRDEALEPALAQLLERAGDPPAGVILIEGVSSAAPALADLVTRAVFVQTPERVRLERLHGRISDEEWDEEWLYAERLYFASRPPDSFDLVVSGTP